MNELMRKILFLPEQASSVARDIDSLHYLVISITMVGAFSIALAIGIFAIRYRRGGTHCRDRTPDQRPGHTRGGLTIWVEVVAILSLLALFLVFWVIGYVQYLRLKSPPERAMPIYVSGKQWMWSFAYPDGRGSEGVLYVPVGEPIELIMTSRDVIHSFFVPQFRIKQDVVPGRTTSVWFEVEEPGTYDVFCTEYCGTGHSTMRATVVALAPADYDRFLGPEIEGDWAATRAARGGPADSLAARGAEAANRYGCLRCHTTDGTPHIGPSWARVFGNEVLLDDGRRIEADAAYLTRSIMDPLEEVRAGFEPVMPTYRGLIPSPELGAIIEYIRSLRAAPDPTGIAPLAPPDSPDVELPRAGEPTEVPR
jgi:cytochrome c oxidase subunit II